MKIAICVVFSFLFVVSFADHDPANLPDYWNSGEYYDYNWGESESSSKEIANENASKELDLKSPYEQRSGEVKDLDNTGALDGMKDYQIEDNRSNSDENKDADENDEQHIELPVESKEEPLPDDGVIGDGNVEETDSKEEKTADIDQDEEPMADDAFEQSEALDDDAADNDDAWDDKMEDNQDLVQDANDDDLKKIFGETVEILKEDSDNFDDKPLKTSASQELDDLMEEMKNIAPEDEDILDYLNEMAEVKENEDESQDDPQEVKEMIEDIQKYLDKSNSKGDTQNKNEDDGDALSENNGNDDSGEDTVDKAYADLNADLDKLFETLEKLKDDGSEEDEDEEIDDTNVKDYEEKFGWPFKEAAVLSERDDDYASIEDSNLSDIFKENAEDTAAEDTDSNENDNADNAAKLDTAESEQAPIEPVVENPKPTEATKDEETKELDDLYNNDSDDAIEEMFKEIFPENYPYGEDGLGDTEPKEVDAEEIEQVEENNSNDSNADIDEVQKIQRTKMVDELSSDEYDELMRQFKIAHQEDLDINSEDFDKNVAPIHITVTADEPVVVTSPNYPNPYPTNNIIDWVFEGEGMGIELNITDFAVNGALGDYLLVKPGGIDETGHEGLIFSHRLDSKRMYRFFDVDRMFVRFEAKLGMMFLRGFQFSVKSIFPANTIETEDPKPEAVVNPPRHTLAINLAGVTPANFSQIEEQFLYIIADMARKYIDENDIYLGYNSTLEVAQITRRAVCSIHWPNYESCVEVTFGVPLNYGDEDLEPRLNFEDLYDMWRTMSVREQFEAQLHALGVTEYAIPNDRTVLTVWLVIAAGVVISMAMLAFALWRFSCFEDYTRMKAFSDTDSVINEKKNLDLYPTPHQTLPPLYAENEYQWTDEKYDDSTRVDMGGFANKSYIRDELYHFDSDEDVISPRDRKDAISPKDIYPV